MGPPSQAVGVSLPGYRAPAVGVESPFELLAACHDRVRRSLDLLQRLKRHVLDTGCDDEARSAARDVLRYFDVAAPLHHQDEELHVFPPLLAGPDVALHALVQKLQAEHIQMEVRWKAARSVLQDIVNANPVAAFMLDVPDVQRLDDFVVLYARHMDDEEQTVYPASRESLSEPMLQAMGQEMGERRGLSPVRGRR